MYQTQAKRQIRGELSLLLDDSFHCFTLPGRGWIFEKLVNPHFKNLTFTCCERDEREWVEVVRNKVTNSRVHKVDALDYLLTTPEKFNFIWLDLCSCLTPRTFTDLIQICKEDRLYTSGGYFCITLTMTRTQGMSAFKDFYGVRDSYELVDKLIDLITKNSPLRLVSTTKYDSDGGTPMMSILMSK